MKKIKIPAIIKNASKNSAERKKGIMAERENYLAGIGKSYSWEEVKQMALAGKKRDEL